MLSQIQRSIQVVTAASGRLYITAFTPDNESIMFQFLSNQAPAGPTFAPITAHSVPAVLYKVCALRYPYVVSRFVIATRCV